MENGGGETLVVPARRLQGFRDESTNAKSFSSQPIWITKILPPASHPARVFAGASLLLLRFPLFEECLEVFKCHSAGAFKLIVLLGIEKFAVAVEYGQGGDSLI